MRRLHLVAGVVLGACLALAPSALASNHLIKIREVYPGSLAHTGDEYVDLQMYAPGQNFFNHGTTTTLYDASGNATTTFTTSSATPNPPNGASQDYVLIATQGAVDDFALAPVGYIFSPGDHLSPAGGAACYVSSDGVTLSQYRDCVSWGSFNGTLPSPTGGAADSAAGIPDGDALNRSIAAGCDTLLEANDDTNDPSDWSDVEPNPLRNIDTPTEHACPTPPNTTITKAPNAKTTDRTPTFKFNSSKPGSTFECKLDTAAFASCVSPLTTKKLSLGKHTFKVRASIAGLTDPTPAHASFKVIRKHH
jgi:hypothetical protein